MAGVVRISRQRLILTALVVGGIGLAGSAWMSHRPARAAAGRAVASVPLAIRIPADRLVRFESPDDPPRPAAPAESAPGAVEELPASAAGQFAVWCDLQLLAADADLDLTTKQWSAFAEAVVLMQSVRHHYESQIAVVREVAPGRHRIEIPAYASAGDELRRQFVAELESHVGREAATEIMDKLGRRLEARFAGFGVGTQTLEITGDPARSPADVQVARTAKFWNSVDGPEWTTTSREVHLPAAEDPTGAVWSALLALVPSAD